ncbi:hypothetical protein CFP56_043175 [Quercus suber]|uniref:Uncharacterized protein n=1 Tax=Quercus suber TaxID=58331 RepID=A0AAW0ISQ9_QUESU
MLGNISTVLVGLQCRKLKNGFERESYACKEIGIIIEFDIIRWQRSPKIVIESFEVCPKTKTERKEKEKEAIHDLLWVKRYVSNEVKSLLYNLREELCIVDCFQIFSKIVLRLLNSENSGTARAALLYKPF